MAPKSPDNLRSLAVDHLAVVNLRLMDDAQPDQRFGDQLAAMVKARDDGLTGGIGLSNVSLDHLRHALAITDIACAVRASPALRRRELAGSVQHRGPYLTGEWSSPDPDDFQYCVTGAGVSGVDSL